MQVSVKYVAPGLFEKPTFVELPVGSTIPNLVERLILILKLPDLFFDYNSNIYTIFIVNGKKAELDYNLAPNDQIVIIPPIGGG